VGQGAVERGDAGTATGNRWAVRRPPAVTDVAKMIRSAEGTDKVLAMLVVLAAVTGARRGELCALRWRDYNPERGTICISRSLGTTADGLVEKSTKTHAERVLAIDDTICAMIDGYRDLCDVPAASGHRDPVTDESPGITYDGKTPMHPDTASHAVRRLARDCGVDTHLHALRHLAATTMVGSGVDIRTVAGRLGHADAATTLRVYAHALPERDREAAGILAKGLL
jgi:integrase